MHWCLHLSLFIPDYRDYGLLIQFSVSKMILLSNSYLSDETEVILNNRKKYFITTWVSNRARQEIL